MHKNSYILCYEDFYFEEVNFDLSEASQDTVKSLQGVKAHYIKRAQQIQKKQEEAVEVLSKIKEKEGKTTNSMTKKIYQARAGEERFFLS
jgi:hypothetical protein